MIDYKLLLGTTIDERESTFRVEDTILYALALGFGADPADTRQLKYVYEEHLQALPCMSLIMAYPGFWLKNPKYQVDWSKVLHAEEALEIHAPLPVAGTVRGRTMISNIIDRGDKGAFIYTTKELHDLDGTLLASIKSTTVARGDGGFGGPSGNKSDSIIMPTRAPDIVCDLPTLPQQALLYRLCGDMNPLHADPAIARKVGFERPILHGRCTLGIAQHAIIKSVCDYDSTRLRKLQVRFSSPFLPGETLRTNIWREGSRAIFNSYALERDVMVLNYGVAEIG